MALITPEIDLDKQTLKTQYQTIRTRLAEIQTQMQGSPSPAQAYAAVDDLADALDKTLVVLKKLVT